MGLPPDSPEYIGQRRGVKPGPTVPRGRIGDPPRAVDAPGAATYHAAFAPAALGTDENQDLRHNDA